MNTRHTLYLCMLACGCTCNQEPSPAPPLPMPEVASDRAKEYWEEAKRMEDSIPPTEESQRNIVEKVARMDSSRYRDHTDEQITATVRGMIAKYRTNCDTAVFGEWKRRIARDLVFQEWSKKHKATYLGLRDEMKAVRDSCNGSLRE